ncbi:LLM class flavin-dependent oxidoreductase [Methylobacterium oryzisoli]|uniref:LLM class flavin-dependent oxidoreductase n=1 Tax=Methylobacterium oryzisoli TaxID=3385502 RepID=UPI003892B2C4
MTSSRLHLVAILRPAGLEAGAGRRGPGGPDADFTLHHLARVARTLERGVFDAALVAEAPGAAPAGIDPLTLLPALAMATEHLGLIAPAPAGLVEPAHVARKFASLDRLTGGRAGWFAAAPGGAEDGAEAEARVARAAEFLQVVTGLWRHWAAPAETPQPGRGHPVIVLDAASPEARRLAAAQADLVVMDAPERDAARAIRAELTAQATALGRAPDALRVLQKAALVLAASEAEAADKARRIEAGAARPGPEAASAPLRVLGPPCAVADTLEAWWQEDACDGFALLIPPLTACLDEVVDDLVPELRRRGLMPGAYAGRTLRSQLGLAEEA